MTVSIFKLFVIEILCFFSICFCTDCILKNSFCTPDIKNEVENILNSSPNLKHLLTNIEEYDFLQKYKLGVTNEDKFLNMSQLLFKNGYKLEKYSVVTEDGYIISVDRIPGEGDPVLLVHGLMNSAIDWFTIGRESALPYLLADKGYDVWLLNARGTTEESKGHIRLSADRFPEEYWDFSWDEIGRYDLPVVIDRVLYETGKSTLKYVGFSQGTTAFFVLASERPEYNEKVSLMVTLSPVAWMSNLKSPLVRLLAPGTRLSEVTRKLVGYYEFNPKKPFIEFLTKSICGDTALATLVCGNLLFSVTGFDPTQINITQMPVIFGHAPSAVSSRQLIHYGQGINSGKFRRYDYGRKKNIVKYGTVEPPEYPVENINTSVALFYRKSGDWFSGYEDVIKLRNKLQNVVDFYEVPHDHWCHTDYIWAKDVKTLVYDRVLDLFQKY